MEAIIIQETDESILDVLTIALEQENYQVYALKEDDCDFLALIEKTRPHVVMLDYRLSGERCIEIFRQIKAVYPHLPMIALSCNDNINSVAIELGFDDYIKKPFDIEHLYATLRKYISKPANSILKNYVEKINKPT